MPLLGKITRESVPTMSLTFPHISWPKSDGEKHQNGAQNDSVVGTSCKPNVLVSSPIPPG